MKRIKGYIENDKLEQLELGNNATDIIKLAEILTEMAVIKDGAAQEMLEFYGNGEGSLINIIMNETDQISYIEVEEFFEMLFRG